MREKLADPGAVWSFAGEEDGESEGALPDVGPGRLPDGLLGPDEVEGVVGHLEHEPELPGPGAHRLDGRARGIGGHCPQPGRGPDQAGGLAADHPVVLLDGVIQIADQLQLSGLALDQLCVGAGQQSDRLLAEPCRRHLRGARHEEVARQDRHRVRPVGVDGCRPAAGVRLIDHIVVVEASDVDQLHGDPGLHRTVILTGPELGCQQS